MESRTYGYVRVSHKDQNEARQVAALAEYGVSDRNIKIDKVSGKNFQRPAYLSLVGTELTEAELRKGDLLVILSIDRLGRNYKEITEQWKHITDTIGADIVVLDMPLLDTRQGQESLDGRFVANLTLQILSYVAEKEHQSIKARQAQGIALAKANGKTLGRPFLELPSNFIEVYERWRNNEITAVEAMAFTGMKKTTFYKVVKKLNSPVADTTKKPP